MQNDLRSRNRERRTAWFIAAVMVAALLYFASQGGILRDLLSTEEAPPEEYADRSAITRRAVELPLDFPGYERARISSATTVLRANAVNWVVLRVPLWIPSPRGIEYSSFDLRRIEQAVRQLKDAGFGVSIAPVYWDGDSLRAAPSFLPPRAFFRGYRVMLLDMAAAAASASADALLLDGLFGFGSVTAGSWLQLLTDIRGRFPGSIEARMDSGFTPQLYLRHIDGAHLSSDLGRVTTLRKERDDARIYLQLPSKDEYASSVEAWQPVLVTADDVLQAAIQLISQEEDRAETEGFTLTGMQAYRQLLRKDSPLARAMSNRRQRGLIRELKSRQQELLPAAPTNSEPNAHRE